MNSFRVCALARRAVFAVSLLGGAAACAAALAVQSQPVESQPVSTRPAAPDPQRFAREIAAFVEYDRKNTPPENAILFVGSSSIAGWPTRAAFAPWPVINRGFGGSQMSDLNHYFDQVVRPCRPRAIVVYEGDNDLADGRAAAEFAAGAVEFVRRVREHDPRVPIVFLTIKPSASRWARWPEMQAANALLRGLAQQQPDVQVVDVATPLLGADGRPRAELYKPDRLHLNAAGYEVWTKTLRAALEPLMR